MSLWSYEHDVNEIGVEACGVWLCILILGVGHSRYNMDVHKIVSKCMKAICQHRFLDSTPSCY